jgi:hypothetical protein
MQPTRRGSRQADLLPRSKRATIGIDEHHRFVQVTDELDWTELEQLVESIRTSKLKSAAGRPPHLRALTGALVFRAARRMTYRETEDQIRYYVPARYLCGLTESEWTPDANTIQDFEQLLGEDGVKRINEYVVKLAVAEKLADPKIVAADTTAQEAPIPYPNEMRLMATFCAAVAAASKSVGARLATLAKDKRELVDAKFAIRAVKDHIALFGRAPRAYAYDRAGSSRANVVELKKLGVKHVGLAPRGQAAWDVRGKIKQRLVSERAQVEAAIGAIKCGKYGFNRPAARSASAMGMCGQRAVLGYNLNKLVRGLAESRGVALVG